MLLNAENINETFLSYSSLEWIYWHKLVRTQHSILRRVTVIFGYLFQNKKCFVLILIKLIGEYQKLVSEPKALLMIELINISYFKIHNKRTFAILSK